MLAVGLHLLPAAADSSSIVPLATALGGILLGLGGLGGILTARAQRQNYVQTGYKDLAELNKAEAAEERAARERAEYSRDRWRAHAYALRDEMAAAGITPRALPPTDHPSEAL